jgi:hypothetical protein
VASSRIAGIGAQGETADPASDGVSSCIAAKPSGKQPWVGAAGEPWCVTIFWRLRYRRLRAA